MNWEAVGAIAEVVGVIAIFVSLVYVAVQIRQNTQQAARSVKANELAAFERNIESGNRMRELLIMSPEITELLVKGSASYGDLGSTEKLRFGLLLRNIFSGIQGAYVRQLTIEHDPLGFDSSALVVDDLVRHPGVREWLDKNEPDWRPEFREFVCRRVALIEQGDSVTPAAVAGDDTQ
jgi:hypothetical protein